MTSQLSRGLFQVPFCYLTTLGLFILKFLAFGNSDIVINMITQRVLISLVHRRIEEYWSRSHRVFFSILWSENLQVFFNKFKRAKHTRGLWSF